MPKLSINMETRFVVHSYIVVRKKPQPQLYLEYDYGFGV